MKRLLILLTGFCLLVWNTGQAQEQAQEPDYIKLGNDCFDKGDYECAKKYFNVQRLQANAVGMDAKVDLCDKSIGLLTVANFLFAEKDFERAKEKYEEILVINPKDPFAKNRLELCDEAIKANNKPVVTEKKETELPVDNNISYPTEVKPEINTISIDTKDINRRTGMFYAAGGVSVAAGVAATFLLSKPYTKYSDSYRIKGKKYNLVYATAGVIAGGVCVGKGIQLKKNASKQARHWGINNSPTYSPSLYNTSLTLVAYGSELGLRFNF